MNIKELRKKLQAMEKEGMGDIPVVILQGGKKIIVETIEECGSGIHSSCEYALINRKNNTNEYVPDWR